MLVSSGINTPLTVTEWNTEHEMVDGVPLKL